MTSTLTAPTLTESRLSVAAPSSKNGFSTAELDLSLWLAALQSFLDTENLPLAGNNNNRQGERRDWIGEIRVVGWGLLKCSQLSTNLRLAGAIKNDALAGLQKTLQESFALCESLSAQGKIDFTAWTAWCANLENELKKCEMAEILREKHQTRQCETLPPALERLMWLSQLQGILGAEVGEIFGRLCNLLERLRLIEEMLKSDQPLKPALLLFALLKSETRDLLAQAGRTMTILPSDAPLYEVLDGFTYVTPMELRKVYEYELVGVGEMRQTPAIFARIENACGLLKDCFQQAAVALAQVFAPDLTAAEVFPNQQDKLKQSIVLRRELWLLLKFAGQVEKSLEPALLREINARLADFRQNTMPFLMFKDVETTERFIEEIARTRRNEEIAQVLHRFGAYLETLLGQVNMRNVLAGHPFDYPEAVF